MITIFRLTLRTILFFGGTLLYLTYGYSQSYFELRESLINSKTVLESQEKAKIAFLGGSITYNPGWRNATAKYIEERFTDTEFEFINAGIPSMGSTPDVFRMNDDVLSKGKIDLLFVEAAVNDATNGRTKDEQIRAIEGIVRKARKSNPKMGILIMYFVDPEKMEDYRNGNVPEVIKNHEKVAKHYGIASLDLAKEVTDRIDNKEFTWKADFVDLHPSPFGQRLYARSIQHLLDCAWAESQPKSMEYKLPETALDPYNYENAKWTSIENAKLNKKWKRVESWTPENGEKIRKGFVEVPMLVATEVGAKLTFEFEGKAVSILEIAGPDVGILEYRIDKGPFKKLEQFTQWSGYLHLPWVYVLEAEMEEGRHVLEIRTTNKHHPKSKGVSSRIIAFGVN